MPFGGDNFILHNGTAYIPRDFAEEIDSFRETVGLYLLIVIAFAALAIGFALGCAFMDFFVCPDDEQGDWIWLPRPRVVAKAGSILESKLSQHPKVQRMNEAMQRLREDLDTFWIDESLIEQGIKPSSSFVYQPKEKYLD